jgi:hypothetical protein
MNLCCIFAKIIAVTQLALILLNASQVHNALLIRSNAGQISFFSYYVLVYKSR